MTGTKRRIELVDTGVAGHGMWRDRLRSNPQLVLLSLFGLLGVVAIAPFAVFRFLAGDIVIGVVDSVIVLAMVGTSLYAWRTDRLDRAGNIQAVVTNLACAAVVVFLDLSYLWVFSTFLATFVIAEQRFATVISIATLAIIASQPGFADAIERMTFVAVSGMVILFALIFANRTRTQHEQLRRLASIDPLTGVANRRVMRSDLVVAAQGYYKNNQPYALAIMDIDYFKRVNDQHGHEAGDRVLIDMASIVQDVIRRGDQLYRYGGEEFVVLFSCVDDEGLELATDKVLEAVRDRLTGPSGPVTVSIGATALRAGESWSEWLARADQALYQAKAQGRDQTVISLLTVPI
jgi:diguanylate cyclase (GGDEF)-like protein